MNDVDVVKAVCCVAGADSDVTVDELAELGSLARRVGIERTQVTALLERSRDDEAFYQHQIDLLTDHADASMNTMIRLAREAGTLADGHVVMLLWRLATKLDIHADHFEELVAAPG